MFRKSLTAILALIALAGIGPSAKAAATFTLTQVGDEISFTGGGTLNLAGLTNDGSSLPPFGALWPGFGILVSGATATEYVGLTGPATFGSGGPLLFIPGAFPGIDMRLDALVLPNSLFADLSPSYVFSYTGPNFSALPDSDLVIYGLDFSGTFAGLGLTPGASYTWTWGSGATADSYTLDIAGVPEPASGTILALPAAMALLLRRHRRALGAPSA